MTTYLFVFITLLLLTGLPLFGVYYAVKRHNRAVRARDAMLRQTFGKTTQIFRTFPIPAALEEVVQGGLHHHVQRFRELLAGEGWLFIQPTYRTLHLFTAGEDRRAVQLSLYAQDLGEVSPMFVIRNRRNPSLLSRYHQTQIERGQLVGSELEFDDGQNLYAEKGKHIQALQIMSPEVLEVLRNSPRRADIVIKKNQLYYLLPGDQPAEEALAEIRAHAGKVAAELAQNLRRWKRSAANKAEYEKIRDSELSVTLVEEYERRQQS